VAAPAKRVSHATFARLAHIARTNPAALGRWGPYLATAAARSLQVLACAHFVLSGSDAEYSARARRALGATDDAPVRR
jgi:hypothetical protein